MRKLVAFLLCAALCLCLITMPADAASADSAAVSAAALNMMGALQGDGSGSLNLDGTLTRAQFCKMAITVMGLSKSVGQYAGYTIFPDVPSGCWEAGYVNLAVRSAGIMSGYPNGIFGPGDIVTYGQAVTVLMKMLGYTTAEVGYNWPYSFLSKAQEIGLTAGVTLTAAAPISRSSAAILFVNLLNTEMNGVSKKFMETISGATVLQGVFLVSVNAETDNGTGGAVSIAGAESGVYLPVASVPDMLIGNYGALVLNASGKALVFVPAAAGRTVVSTVSDATSSGIECANGTKITMTSSSGFYMNDASTVYADGWVNIEGGMLVSAYYSDGGALQCVMVTNTDANTSSVTVVKSDTYALPVSAAVYINGNEASAADINKYDVISDSGTGIYKVTRRRITGCYEDATPNTGAPDTVKVLGTEFTVLDSAAVNLAEFDIGDSVTLLLTSEGKVAGAVSGSILSTANYGVVTSFTSTTASVRLAGGTTVSGSTMNSSANITVGSLVTVGNYSKDYITLYPVSWKTASLLDIENGTLGTMKLSKAVTVYECVGNSAVCEISLSDISTVTVEALKVKFYATDTTGDVSLLLLSDVTGDLYTYGFIKNSTVTQTYGGMSATNPTTSVTNGGGTSTALIGSTGLPAGTPAGIAATGDGSLAGYAELTAVAGVARSSFVADTGGTLFVSTPGGLIEVASDVQAYVESTELWTTLSKARSYSDNLTVYYDKTPTTGGKVRIVIAK